MVHISIQNFTRAHVPLKRIRSFIFRILKLSGIRHGVLAISFISPRVARDLNFRYRKKRKPATILTFVYRDNKIPEADILLCPHAIRSEAKQRGLSANTFLFRLLVHGVLHFKGWKHVSGQERAMEKEEEVIMRKINTTNF